MKRGLTASLNGSNTEQKLSSVLNQLSVGIASATKSGAFIEANDRYCQIVGRSREELLKVNLQELTHPDDLAGNINLLQKCIDHGECFTIEKRYVKPDGSIVWVNNSVALVKGETEEENYLTVVTIDISASKESEKALKNSEKAFRDLADTMPQMLWAANAEGEVYYFNKKWTEYTGTSVEDRAASWSDIIHPDDIPRSIEAWTNALASGEPYDVEYRVKHKGGNDYRWFLTRAVPVKDEQGHIQKWYGTATDLHDQKLKDQALEESENRYRYIFETAAVSIWEEDFSIVKTELEKLKENGVTDLENFFAGHPDELMRLITSIKVKDVNRESLTLFSAKTKADLIEGLGKIVLPETIQIFIKEFEAIARGDAQFKGETVLRTMDGKKMDVLFTIAFPSTNDYSSVLVTILDQTEQKQFEARLKEREERFRNLADNAPMFVWMTDAHAHVTYANRNLLEYVGIETQEQFLDNAWEQMTHPDDIAPVYKIYSEALADPKPFNIEVRFKQADTGRYSWFLFKAVPIYEQKNFTGFIGTAVNIQGFKDAEEAIKENFDQLKTIIDAQPHLASIIPAETPSKAIYYSQSWYEYTGQSKDEALQEGAARAYFHPDDLERIAIAWYEDFKNGRAYEGEARLRDKYGDYYWHYMKAIPVSDSEGKVKLWISTSTNIHRQKLFTEELERQVEERTHSLQDANRKLESSNQELERFAYIASHDLQEPLRKVKAFGDMLKSKYYEALGTEGSNLIDRMQCASYRMGTLIEDLLSYSRVSANLKPQEPVDLNQITSEVLADLETTIKEKNATIDVAGLPIIKGDEIQLRQLVQNLISNGIKFSKPGTAPEVTVRCEIVTGRESGFDVLFKDAEKKFLYLRISDNGIGFEQQYAGKIFQIFQRLNGRSDYEGSGIGLSIVKKVVENHKGYITAEGQPNAGATFKILLPL